MNKQKLEVARLKKELATLRGAKDRLFRELEETKTTLSFERRINDSMKDRIVEKNKKLRDNNLKLRYLQEQNRHLLAELRGSERAFDVGKIYA